MSKQIDLPYGQYTNSLTGSDDITSIVIRLYPQEYEAIDFGSSDIIYANSAEMLVWQPIKNWIFSK